jgi:methyl-accepting chemotaxis protein
MRAFTIKSRMFGGFGFLVVLIIGLVVYGIGKFTEIGGSVGKMNALAENSTRALEIQDYLERMRRSGLRYAYDFDEPSLKENGEVAASALATLDAAEKATLSEERRKTYLSLQDGIRGAQKDVQDLAENAKLMQADQAKLFKVGDDLTARANALVEKVRASSDQSLVLVAEKLNSDLLAVRVANWRTQATRDQKGLATLKDAATRAAASVASLEGADIPADARALVAPLKATLADYAAASESVIAHMTKVGEVYLQKISPEVRQMQATIVTAKTSLQSDFGNTRAAVETLIGETIQNQKIVAGFAALFACLIAFLIARSVSNPIAALTRAMRELAEGNFSVVLPGLGRKDEVGDIAQAVEAFKVKAAEKAQREAEEKAEQDRRAEAERQAAMARMADEFQAAVGSIVQAAVAGDFSQRVALTGKTGLVLNVGTMINTLCDNVAKVTSDLAEMLGALAQGDLTRRITAAYQGRFATLKDDANATAEKIGATISEIKRSAREVTNASSEISTSTTDLSQRTEEQAASLEETSASMEQMAATVKKNAENAQQANQSAGTTREVADRGGRVVAKAVEAMARIEESSRKISDIIGVIDEIARQTNLLALNAAVEAARAGDAGRGFAVVASEVRSLAQRSSQAAKDIKDLITNSNGQVKEGVELVNEAGSALNEIVESIRSVAQIVAEIAAASAEQSTGIDQVNKALSQMDEVTQQNSALVEENAATAKTLEHQSTAMDERVAFFRVAERDDVNLGGPVAAAARVAAPGKRAVAAKGGKAARPSAIGNVALKQDPSLGEF